VYHLAIGKMKIITIVSNQVTQEALMLIQRDQVTLTSGQRQPLRRA
jgi:hypothetical protein